MTEHYFTNSIGKEERFTVTGAIACDRLDYYSADLVVKSRGGIFFTSSISWHYYAPNTRRDQVQDLCNLVICATFFSFFFIIVFLGSTDKRNKQIFSLGASWLLSGYMLDSLSHFEFNWQQRLALPPLVTCYCQWYCDGWFVTGWLLKSTDSLVGVFPGNPRNQHSLLRSLWLFYGLG